MTCAFLPCEQVTTCALVGGCVQTRFPAAAPHPDTARPGARALNGTEQRTRRDPALIKRRRKALTR